MYKQNFYRHRFVMSIPPFQFLFKRFIKNETCVFFLEKYENFTVNEFQRT